MSSDSPTLSGANSEPALLERARLALQSLQFEEEAARYRAACAELIEAIADAEAGNDEPLKRWLDARRVAKDLQQRIDSPPSGLRFPEEPTSSSDRAPNPSNPLAPVFSPPLDEPAASPVISPWEPMRVAALERAKTWFQSHQQLDEAQPADTSLDLAVDLQRINPLEKAKRSKRWCPPHVAASVIAHGLILVVLAWWVVVSVQPQKEVFLTSGPIEYEDVSLETTLDASPIESETMDQAEAEPPPVSQIENLSLDVPQIAALEGMTGPRSAESTLSSAAGSVQESGGIGTQLASGVEFFGSKAVGNNFVFIVDCSPSMAEDNAFDSAKTEILRSLSMLKPKQRYFILFFGSEIIPIQFPGKPPESFLLPANRENIEKTTQWIQRLSIQKNGLHPLNAIREALAMQPDGIFLLFDGKTSSKDWRERINTLNRTDDLFSQGDVKVPIHVVHFFQEDHAVEMKRVADDNHGSYRFVPRPPKEKRGAR